MKIILLVLCVIWLNATMAQETVLLKVYDSTTNLPIEKATIQNLRSGKFYLSNSKGQKIIEAAEGDTIAISSVGYKKLIFKTVGGYQNIALSPEIIEMENLFVTTEPSTFWRNNKKRALELNVDNKQEYYVSLPLFKGFSSFTITKVFLDLYLDSTCTNTISIFSDSSGFPSKKLTDCILIGTNKKLKNLVEYKLIKPQMLDSTHKVFIGITNLFCTELNPHNRGKMMIYFTFSSKGEFTLTRFRPNGRLELTKSWEDGVPSDKQPLSNPIIMIKGVGKPK